MTQRQSNNQWSGVIAAHADPPQKIPSAKSAGKVLASIFWEQGGILLIDYLPKGQNINAEYYSSLLVQLKDILKEKRTRMPRLTGHLQSIRNAGIFAEQGAKTQRVHTSVAVVAQRHGSHITKQRLYFASPQKLYNSWDKC